MAIRVNKRKGENFNSLLYRFNKKMKRSGIYSEVKKRRRYTPPPSDKARKASALHRKEQQEELKRMKRYGEGFFGRRN